jgi:hypothetical protein
MSEPMFVEYMTADPGDLFSQSQVFGFAEGMAKRPAGALSYRTFNQIGALPRTEFSATFHLCGRMVALTSLNETTDHALIKQMTFASWDKAVLYPNGMATQFMPGDVMVK